MNIDYEIVESAKTEFSELKNKRYHLDYVGKTKRQNLYSYRISSKISNKKGITKESSLMLHYYMNTPAVLLKPTSFVFKQYRTTRSSISTVKTMFLKLTSCP